MKRLLATVAFVGLFYILALVPLPTVDQQYLQSSGGGRRVHVIALGIRPWVVAFLYVELWSFASRRGRQLRRGGSAGRRRINAFAVRTGIVFAVIQGAGVAFSARGTGGGGPARGDRLAGLGRGKGPAAGLVADHGGLGLPAAAGRGVPVTPSRHCQGAECSRGSHRAYERSWEAREVAQVCVRDNESGASSVRSRAISR